MTRKEEREAKEKEGSSVKVIRTISSQKYEHGSISNAYANAIGPPI